MSDVIDQTDERDEVLQQARAQEIARKAAAIPAGAPGECDYCGEDMPRIVNGACCTCRDRRGLP